MDDSVFVKRVDFEVNNNNQSTPITTLPIVNGDKLSDVEKLAEPEKASCTTKFCVFLEKFGIKSALSHIGLLVSLGLFCFGGGYVRNMLKYSLGKTSFSLSNFSGFYHTAKLITIE